MQGKKRDTMGLKTLILEMAYGKAFREEDIVRVENDYGKTIKS